MNNIALYILIGLNYNIFCSADKLITSEKCREGSTVLNECNWCKCNVNKKYICQSRDCNSYDAFGHFNDAIQGLDVGMEGHGVWRSAPQNCEPGVSYQQGHVLCVCTDEGNWPSPQCKATFQTLYTVISCNQNICSPNKLYLVGCNVCFCSSNGDFNHKYCTKKPCSSNDPVFKEPTANEIKDIYTQCEANHKYDIGCQNCVCLGNNKLHCNACETKDNICKSKLKNAVFNIDCNLCFCDNNNMVICSVKKCNEESTRQITHITNEVNALLNAKIKLINANNCIPGTVYGKGCNICYCYKDDVNNNVFSCTMNQCSDLLDVIKYDCVEGYSYKKNCQLCSCDFVNNIKWERCIVDKECNKYKEGSCEPLKVYKRDCNTCRCMESGNSASCTDFYCTKNVASNGIEIKTITLNSGSKCPVGHAYKYDCNFCFCLSNGNALCTNINCQVNTEK